jgi:hypothetical protein
MLLHGNKMLFGFSSQLNNIYSEELFLYSLGQFPWSLELAFHSAFGENGFAYLPLLNFETHSSDTGIDTAQQSFDNALGVVPTCDFLKPVFEEIHDYKYHRHTRIHSYDSSNGNGEWRHFRGDA